MDRETFVSLRAKLGKTQKSLAELLGVSLKAVQSYEQGDPRPCRAAAVFPGRQPAR
jgi:DNA-binding XRE family transcriptional regulator